MGSRSQEDGCWDWESNRDGDAQSCEVEEEHFGELRGSIKASAKGEGSLGVAQAGPKMRRSLNSIGVIGRTMSSCSGKGHSGDNARGFFLGLKYGSRGSFSIRV